MDRNPIVPAELTTLVESLSARRAWIEIINNNYNDLTRPVALRKESVDRNRLSWHLDGVYFGSLSARRAWIEIAVMRQNPGKHYGRSPQGERG